MPRPGPRPYDCVRRAWHSERHQPMRGSLIQEIFRLVNEVHKPTTKKNKEWQEKLPVVVLKAEEIMYSKANSEAEYIDLKTLWERANDAIDTIIRRDESTETGDLLHPCIEAALNLGCPIRRTSRSQRYNPRNYLSSNAQGPSGADNTTQGTHLKNSQSMINCPTFMKPTANGGSSSAKSLALTFQTAPQSNVVPCSPVENHPAASNKCLGYPLYYGRIPQIKDPLPHLGSFTTDSDKASVVQDHITKNAVASGEINRTGTRTNLSERQSHVECDLSLRLGTFSVPCPNFQNSRSQEVENVGSMHSRLQMHKDLPLFSRSNVDDPLNAEVNMRKRKAPLSYPLENQPFCWQPKLPYGHLTGRMKSAGL